MAIGALALELHQTGSEELSGQLSEGVHGEIVSGNSPYYQIENNKVRFTSLESRNRTVAAYAFKESSKTLTPDSEGWITVAYDLWRHEIRSDDSAAGRLLALVHEKTDILTIAATAIGNKSIEVFKALNTLEVALPYLKVLHVDGIERLSKAQHELTKGDAAAGLFFARLGKSLVDYPDVCRDIHRRLREEITEGLADLYARALVALASSSPQEAVKVAVRDAESEIDLLRSVALWTLGRLILLSFVDAESAPAVCNIILSNISHSTENVRRTAVLAAAGATPKTDGFVEKLSELGRAADPLALEAITQTVWANLDDIKSKPYFSSWLKYLCKLPVGTIGSLSHFDHVISRLLSDTSQQPLALSCVTEWITSNGKGGPHDDSIPEHFEISTLELARRPALLSQLITNCFLADDRRLASAAGGLLRYLQVHGLEKPELSIDKLDTLKSDDLLFLARRLLGFVFSDGHLLSLSMSFFKANDAPNRTFPILRALLVDEIGYDYPSSTIEALEAADLIEVSLDFKAFYSHAIKAIKSRMEALAALPRLTELSPSPNLQRQFSKARAKQINKAMMAERKKSIIRQIVTEVPIKAGIGWFSFRDGAYTEPSYLKSVSHSVELPRRSTLDTVGAELRMWSMSQSTRDDS